jgi:DNA-binding MarR family transcriptional regulator
MTNMITTSDAAALAEVLRRLFTIRSRIQITLPEEIASAKARLDETRPGGRDGLSTDYELLHRIARILIFQPEPISMGELSRALEVPLSSATRIVDWLEDNRFAERLPDPSDRRVVRIELTEAGREIYRAGNAMMQKRIEKWLQRFTSEETTELVRLLDKLAGTMEDEIAAG